MPESSHERRLTRRRFLQVSAGSAAAAVLAACTASSGSPPGGRARARPAAPTGPALLSPDDPMVEVACGLPREWVLRMARGYHPERSAEIQILPREPNFVGAGLPHVGPWDHTSRVPMFWYGPGFIEPLGVVRRRATAADISPTWARLLGVPFETPDGRPIGEVLVPASRREEPPRLVVTVIWDGAGRNVLDEWPDEWPNLRALVPDGAWIEEAEVGSSPTSSAQIHATVGTGAFPRSHGIVGHSLRVEGEIVSPWSRGPALFLRPTLADVYEEAMGNQPLVGALGTVAIQLGMLGHGAAWPGNEKPLVVLRAAPDAETLGAEGTRWNLPDELREWYRFPEYANDLPALATYFDAYDRGDGARDGRWRGHSLQDEVVQGGFQTPARIPYQTRLVEEVIRREGLGRDEVPDLLYVNYKLIDQVGHIFSMNSREMQDSLRAQDEHLPVLIDVLNREVGEGRWAMLVTADHGSTPHPDVSGAFQISAGRLHGAIQEAFGGDDLRVVEQVKQTEVFIDEANLAERGATLRDVAEFIMGLTQGDLAIPEVSNVTDPGARVFEAAFPSRILPALPCLPGDQGAGATAAG